MSFAVIGLVRSRAAAALLVAIAVGIIALAASGSRDDSALMPSPKVVGGELYLPGAAHVAGTAGTNWRSDLEIYNVGPTAASYQIALLRQNRPNPSPSTISFTLGPRKSVRYGDLVDSLFHQSGSAALRITSSTPTLMANCRTYNQTAQGTYGQFISALDPAHALGVGDRGRLIQLTHSHSDTSGYRTNLGFLNLSGTRYNVTVEYFLADGTQLGAGTVSLDPYEFKAVNGAFGTVTGAGVADGFVIVTASSPVASYLAYASVVDNRTGDPIYIPAQVAGSTGPNPTATPGQPGATSTPTRTPTTHPPTATPTRTPTQSGPLPNLAPAVFTGWDDALVLSGVEGTNTTGGLVGGASTFMDVGVGNFGQQPVTLPANSMLVAVDLDGSFLGNLGIGSSPVTLETGFGVSWTDIEITNVTAGPHTVTMRIDPDNHYAESDEDDNSYSVSATWSGRKARYPAAAIEGDPGRQTFLLPQARPAPIRDLEPAVTWSKASGTPIYIMASANVAGSGGTQWRTDLEVHNPGTGQVQFEVALLKSDRDNSNPQTFTAAVAGGRCRRFQDVLASRFAFTGSAALRITPLSGTVMVTSRTYNLTASGTFGQFIGGISASDALITSQEAALIQLSHQNGGSGGARTNAGFVNTGGTPIVVELDGYRADGSSLGTRQWSVLPYGHIQINRVIGQFTGSSMADAFGIVRTRTAGGRFLAYASVVDNDTGDPILVPAVQISSGGVSTPTATPTLPPTQPLPPLDVADFVSGWLGSVPGGGDVPGLEGAVQDWQTNGFSSILNEVRNGDPGIVSVAGNTITADYGSGTSLPDGTLMSGSLQLTFSNLVNNSSRVAFHVVGAAPTLLIDGASLGMNTSQADLDLARTQGGHLAGTVTFSAISNKSGDGVTGNLEVDTALCERYPVGGSVTFNYEGETHHFTVPNTCDGSYDYSGPDATPTPAVTPTATPGTGDIAFRLTWSGNPNTDYDLHVVEPSGEEVYYGNSTSDTGGELDIDCVCSNCSSPIENIFWGTGMAPHGTFTYWVDVFSTCGQSGSRNCRMQVLVNGAVVRTHDLSLNDGESQHYTYQY